MKRIRIFTLVALLGCGLALTACKGGGNGNAAQKGASDKNAYIAKTIFDLIPKEDLPDYCAHVQQIDYSDYDPADVPAFDPTFFAGNVEGHMVEGMDSGFYGYVNVKCYPLEGGGWRAYWAAYGGYDGLCGFDRSGAYNYVDGKLTKEEIWLLPTPNREDLLSADLIDALKDSGEWEYMRPNYSYTFGSGEDGLLSVSLDVDYLFYPEEGSDAAYPGMALDVDYGWNGQRLVRQDFDDLDEVQMRAIGLMLGFQPEEFHVENGGFMTFDPEEESDNGQDNYYNYVQTYPVTDDNGIATRWKVLNYELGTRELSSYDFDGTRLTPGRDPIAEAWNKIKDSHDEAFVWLSEDGVNFCEPRGDVADFAFAEYRYSDNAFLPAGR